MGVTENERREVRFEPRFRVLQETADVIVVDKPAPLLVHPSVPGNPPTLLCGLEGLLAYEIANGARLSIINRLDRETSGVVVVAKHTVAARELHTAMERREVEKEYVALVWGWPEGEAWEVDGALRRRGEVVEGVPVWVEQCVDVGGAEARTRFEVMERLERGGERFSLVRARPETGRMHQIRVHLEYSGLPLVGDKIYGRAGRGCYLEFIETGWTEALRGRLLLPRQALHCERMALEGWGEWRAEMPEEMRW